MKKFFALVLALALTMSLCAVSLPASADDKPVELKVWILGPGTQADQPEVFALFNEKLHETLPNISVDIEIVSGDYKDRFSRAMSAQERLDLAWIGWHHNIADEARDGTIIALDDLLEKYGQGIIESLGTETLDNHRLTDGHLYQLPSWQGMVGGRSAAYLPSELIEASGVGENWLSETQDIAYGFWADPSVEKQQALFDQFALYYQGLVDAGKIYKGMATATFTFPGWNGEGRVANVCNGGYVRFGDDTFTVKDAYDNEFVKNYYKTMAEFYDKGYIRSDIASAASTATWDDGLDDQDIVTNAHNAWTDDYGKKLEKNYGFPCEVVYNSKTNLYNLGRATGMCIPYTSEYPEEAMTFLNEVYVNAPLYQLLIYGEEGKHWVEDNDDDHSITVLGGASQPTSDFAYGLWCWTIGTCENVRLTQNLANDPSWYAELKELEKTAYSSPLLNFSYDKANYEAEVANLAAISKEYGDALGKGYLGAAGWEAHYNKMLDELKANGVDNVRADCQEQLNQYLKDRGVTAWNYDGQ